MTKIDQQIGEVFENKTNKCDLNEKEILERFQKEPHLNATCKKR